MEEKPLPDFKVHQLKTDPKEYDLIVGGYKTCDIRLDDRMFNIGDYVIARKTKYTGDQMAGKADGVTRPDFYPLVYTGRALMYKITDIHSGKFLADGYVALSFVIVDKFPGEVL